MSANLPVVEFSSAGEALGRWWTLEDDGRILCQLCPRACRLKEGDRGFCFVRTIRDGRMVLDTYGRSTGFCIDPIEKKPLNHFLPGTPVLSFGTAGCNLGCKFCQNWDISKSREVARLSDAAGPEDIALAAEQHGCRSVAFTYNDPVIWAEYAIDTAAACHQREIKTVAVTAGYITPQARDEFFSAMDAANIDLKAFSEDFYYRITGSHLKPVLDTIEYVCNETDCWVELTNLIIPDANDQADELRRMCDWILDRVGTDIPVHFTAFHPDYRMLDRPRTSHETLVSAYDLARSAGLRYVYVGNVHDVARQSTYCPSCGCVLIQRDWHEIRDYAMKGNQCGQCGFQIAGRFEQEPGHWGQRRLPIRISHQRAADNCEPARSNVTTAKVSANLGAASESPARRNRSNRSAGTEHEKELTMQPATDMKQIQEAFTDEELRAIHRAACRLVTAIVHDVPIDVKKELGELAERPIAGLYVTLKRGETLRGCCGLQGPPVQFATALADAANRTAKHDPRMAPVAAVELPHLTLSFSILGPPRSIGVMRDERPGAVEIGKHGLRIRMGDNAGLLLPVVAKERNWNSRQFLDAVCNKAGLPPGSWRSDDAIIEIFDGIDFGAPFDSEAAMSVSEVAAFDRDSIQRLRHWVHTNLIATQTGATPLYYATDVSDCSVQGIVLQVEHAQSQPLAGWTQLSLRDGIPLQSTLFQMTQTAAQSLASKGTASDWCVHLAILTTVVHQGTSDEADLAGVQCDKRALIAIDGRRWSIAFDRHAEPGALLDETLSAQAFRSDATQIYSAICDSTDDRIRVSKGPQARADISSRPPAVAGTFYPSEDEEREKLIDELLSGLEHVEKKPVNAAMVPHAGLRYSGRIAADVWRRIEFPESVLIIGPKHTTDGVDWAVAPHNQWRISPTATLIGDIDLAERIAQVVPGMELDSQAHQREHGIEVELPLLYRLAPQTRVAAIAMGGGSFGELQDAAQSLGECLSEFDQPPLLVISSDMNHYADDVENRRRDRLALDALGSLDPKKLLETCGAENISMCGQVPARSGVDDFEVDGSTGKLSRDCLRDFGRRFRRSHESGGIRGSVVLGGRQLENGSFHRFGSDREASSPAGLWVPGDHQAGFRR